MKAPNFTRNQPTTPCHTKLGERRGERSAHGGELVAGVADEHAGLSHGAVADRDALDEPGGAGRHGHARLSPIPRAQGRGETGEERARRERRPGGTVRNLATFGA